jgi:2'-hydroxyisoflavone reductase
MRLLILGGTRFLGRHLAEQALAAGHTLTLLHRGQSNPGLLPQAEHLIADRNASLAVLAGRQWDAVIDTSAYVPRHVRTVAAVLAGNVGQYQLVSTISVYAGFASTGNGEDAPLAVLDDPGVEAVTGATYGGLKALCEAAAFEAFDAACLVNRPGLLVGPHDPTGRFTWWVHRLQRGGDVLAPGDPAGPVQCIDARDAAAWMLRQAEAGPQAGTPQVVNLTGPLQPLTMQQLLETARTTLNPAATLRWVDEAFVLAQGVAPWSDLPVWLPSADAGLHRTVLQRAAATGLVCRPLQDTLRDTAAWAASDALGGRPAADRPQPGLAPEREAALLAAWAARAGTAA